MCDTDFLLICVNFNVDFVILYRMYFQNYFAKRSMKLESNTINPFTIYPRHCCIRYETLVFGRAVARTLIGGGGGGYSYIHVLPD